MTASERHHEFITDLHADRARLGELRRQIRPRMMARPVCQPEQFARDLEALYLRMWEAWCRGEKLGNGISAVTAETYS